MSGAFTVLDRLILLAYVVALAGLAVHRTLRRKDGDAADYLVAARAITLPGLVANLVATWYGGVLGVGEYSYRYGISNWLVFGVPYYVGAAIFAVAIAPPRTEVRAVHRPRPARLGVRARGGGRRRGLRSKRAATAANMEFACLKTTCTVKNGPCSAAIVPSAASR